MPSPATELGGITVSSQPLASPLPLAKILVIDDEEIVAQTMSLMLKAEGFEVAIARSGEEGLVMLRAGGFGAVITDLVMPGLGGIQTLEAVREIDPDIPVMILTGHATVNATIAALRHGACDFLLKPLSLAQLRAAVTRALTARRPKTDLPLNEGTLSILASVKPEDRVALALKLAKRTMRATAAALTVLPPDEAEPVIELSNECGPLTKAIAKRLTEQALKHRDPIFEPLEPLRIDSQSGHSTLPAGSVLTYALATHGAPFGALMFWRDPSVADFSAFDVMGGRLLADEIAAALDGTRQNRRPVHKVEEPVSVKAEVFSVGSLANAVIATAQESIVLLDKSGVVQDCNPAAEKTFGVVRSRALDRKFAEFAISPPQAAVFEAHLDKAYREGRDPHYGPMKLMALRGNGDEFPIEISTAAIETPQGRLLSTFGRDITLRMQTFDALRASEEQFRQLAENINAVFFICEPDPIRVTYVSPAYDTIWGHPRRECIERPDAWIDSIHPDDRAAAIDLFTQASQGNRSSAEYRVIRPDGSSRNIQSQVFPLLDDQGRFFRLVGIAEDITERKQVEKVLADRAFLASIVESSQDGIAGVGLDGKVVSWNHGAEEIYGYSSEEIIGKSASQLAPPERVGEFSQLFEKVRSGEKVSGFETVRLRKGGGLVDVSLSMSAIYDAEGEITGAAVMVRDITERKKADARTHVQSAALESAANGIVIVDRKGLIQWVNPAFTWLTGYPAEEILGKNPKVLKSGVHGANFYEDLWKTIADGKVWHGELVNRRRDGTLYNEEMTITPVRDTRGVITHFIAIKQDITERKRREQALWASEEQLKAILDNSTAVIYLKDFSGRYIRANRAFETRSGFEPGQIAGKTDYDLFPKEVADKFWANDQRVLRERTSLEFEESDFHDGKARTYLSVKFPLYDTEGSPYAVAGISTEITERKQAEQALAQERDLLHALMDNISDYIYFKDTDGCFVRVNKAHAQALGLSHPREAVGRTDFDFFPLEDAKNYLRDECLVLVAGQPLVGWVEKVRRADGSMGWFSSTKVPIRDGQGRITGLVGVSRDITERKRAEEALQESEERFRSFAASAQDAIVLLDSAGAISYWNDAAGRIFGYSSQEILGKKADEILVPEIHREAFRQGFLHFRPNGETPGAGNRLELIALRKDGREFPVEVSVSAFQLRKKQAILGNLRDISERKQSEAALLRYAQDLEASQAAQHRHAEQLARSVEELAHEREALRQSEERYRELIENASDIVYTTDLDGHMTSLNRVGRQLLGYSLEQMAKLDIWELVENKHWEQVKSGRQRLLAGEADIHMEVEVKAQDGRRLMLDVKPRLVVENGMPVGVQGIGRDITGRDVAEMELRHAQKLESVGRLASGIAHEINTPIQFVGDNTRFLQDSFDGLRTLLGKYQELRDAAASDAALAEMLASVHQVEEQTDCAYLLEEIPSALSQTLDGVTRVATIVRAMKEFAHPESKEMAAADINKALQSTLTVARNELKYVADVELDLGEIPPVVCNVGDLNQVFLNLLVNAAHAIADVVKGTDEKGKICVRTVPEGDTVVISISDTGSGIPEAIRTKIFDPFFTTKEVGRGTGQGLAIARSVVVERHRGTLTFESEVGKGTTFHIRLPIQPPETSKEARAT